MPTGSLGVDETGQKVTQGNASGHVLSLVLGALQNQSGGGGGSTPPMGISYPEQFYSGSGTYDAAIASAIATGNTVQLQPNKTYALSASITTFPAVPGQKFNGMNCHTSVLNQTTAGAHVFSLNANPGAIGYCAAPTFNDFSITGVGVATSTGAAFYNTASDFFGDNMRVRNVICTGMDSVFNINGWGNCKFENIWGHLNNNGFLHGFEGGSNHTGNGMIFSGCQFTNNYKYNVRINGGIGWIFDMPDTNLGVAGDSGANNAVGFSLEGGTATYRGGNCEYAGNTGLRAVKVLNGAFLVMVNASFSGGSGASQGIQPVFVDSISFLNGTGISAGGFTVSAVAAQNGADVRGDDFIIDQFYSADAYSVAVNAFNGKYVWEDGIPSADATTVGKNICYIYRHDVAGRMGFLKGISISDGASGYTYAWSDITNDLLLKGSNTYTGNNTFSTGVTVVTTLETANGKAGSPTTSDGGVRWGNYGESYSFEFARSNSADGGMFGGQMYLLNVVPLQLPNIQSTDPHHAGAVWANLGILTESAG